VKAWGISATTIGPEGGNARVICPGYGFGLFSHAGGEEDEDTIGP
jgi:hypothetical protein